MNSKITFKRILKFLQLAPSILTHIKAIWELVCSVINEQTLDEIETAAKLRRLEDDKHTNEE